MRVIQESASSAGRPRRPGEAGIALVTALLVLLLISSVIVGIAWLTMVDQQLGGNNGDRQMAFYGSEAGLEKLTADLGSLYSQNYSPTGAQINNLATTPPNVFGVQYLAPDGTSGYQITFTPDAKGNPAAQNSTITSGPYLGLSALITPYTLTVTSRTLFNSEVQLTRNVETVGIPVFQFGIFSQTDLSFFAGPSFSFGGRVNTNGNLWLAEGDGNTLTLNNDVTAVGEVIRTNLSNGWPTSGNYTGTVNLSSVPNGATYIPLLTSQGSLVGNLGTAPNLPTWTQVSLGTYNGEIRNWRTGAVPLTLTIAEPSIGGQPVDIIRRPIAGEDGSNPSKLAERYYAQASLRILLSDTATDLMSLPCIDASKQPIDLTQLSAPTTLHTTFPAWYTVNPKAGIAASNPAGVAYSAADGYWLQQDYPLIAGYIKIEEQTSYASPCGTWKDVTQEILNLGFAGRNLKPLGALKKGKYPTPPTLPSPSLPSSQIIGSSACTDPSANAVIRLERVRDNPSTTTTGGCGGLPTSPYDYWPNSLFDTREGDLRDNCPDGSSIPCSGTNPTAGGVIYYVELDVNNLVRWLTGAIGSSGTAAKDPVNSQNDFVIYFSDRRGNYISSPAAGGWPPASPSGHETGEYGSFDVVNGGSQYGCPNQSLDAGEDLDVIGILFNYGQAPFPWSTVYSAVYPPGGKSFFSSPGTGAPFLTPDSKCSVSSPSPIWPGEYYTSAMDARINPPVFFRRALKLVNGSTINLGICPSGVNCGLTIASENPVYVQGNYNAPGGSFTTPYGAASISADSITLLSGNWNDVNSFAFPYDISHRVSTTAAYRFAAASGKGVAFPQPSGYSSPQDFGTDGGVHNFLHLLENWGGASLSYRGSIVSFFYNRQAVGTYKCCTTVYSPPTRSNVFDTDFLTPALLPPRTPLFRDVNTVGFTQVILPPGLPPS